MNNIVREFDTCPRCGQPTKKSIAFNEGESEFWVECIKCNTYINTYIPQSHQSAVHSDEHKFILNAGGFGSGKTYTSRQEFYKHMFLTPNGLTIIGANVSSQYEQTIKRDIEADIPKAFVKSYSLQKSFIDFKNGHRLMFRPFDDPDKLRSLNVTMFIIIEASECKGETYIQLKSRIRNTAATLPKKDKDGNIIYKQTKEGVLFPTIQADWRKGIIETNPDSGWVRSEVLMKSHNINKHGKITDNYAILESERDKAVSSHITASEMNQFLPEGFIDDLKRNRPLWWTRRYIYGSFSYAEGLVYPNFASSIVPTFEVPNFWRRIVAFDYGLSDDAVYLFGAIDERNNLLYIYKEARDNNRSVEDLSKIFFQETKDIPVGGWVCPPIIDPKSGPKRDYDKKSLSDHFLEYGINFIPGHINMDARIYRLNTYFETGRIKIMDCCRGTISELRDYKFKPKTLDDTGSSDKPMDGKDHGITALTWIVMELPANPNNLVHGIYNRMGEDLTKSRRTEDSYGLWAFKEEGENNGDYFNFNSNYW